MFIKCSRALACVMLFTSTIATGNSFDNVVAIVNQNLDTGYTERLKLLNLWTEDAGNPSSLKLFGIWNVVSRKPKSDVGNSVNRPLLSVWDVVAVNPVNLKLLGVWTVPAVQPGSASVKSNVALGKLAHNYGCLLYTSDAADE